MLERKYKGYNPLIFLKVLVYFKDAEKNIDFEEVEAKWLSIKEFFTDYIKSLTILEKTRLYNLNNLFGRISITVDLFRIFHRVVFHGYIEQIILI